MSGIGGQANNMDSISRPTSRVLAPPGGGSSNIFGCGTEPTKEFNKNDPRYKTNNIFGASEPVPKPAAQPTTQAMQANPEPPVPAPPAQSTNSAKENNPVGVSNFFHRIKKINLLYKHIVKNHSGSRFEETKYKSSRSTWWSQLNQFRLKHVHFPRITLPKY